jgi:hypothetical protein
MGAARSSPEEPERSGAVGSVGADGAALDAVVIHPGAGLLDAPRFAPVGDGLVEG